MKRTSLLLLFSIFLSSCSEMVSTAMLNKTNYITNEMNKKIAVISVPKQDLYHITTTIELPAGEKVSYNIQKVVIHPKKDGYQSGAGEKMKDLNTGFTFKDTVKTGDTWSCKAKFRIPVSHGKLVIKLGDSTIFKNMLNLKKSTVYYSFQLP